MEHISLIFLSEWREFPSAPCPAGGKSLVTARVSKLLKSRTSPDMLRFSLCNKKRLHNSAHEQTPLSNDTIDSVLRHREVGRAKDLSVPPRRVNGKCIQTQIFYIWKYTTIIKNQCSPTRIEAQGSFVCSSSSYSEFRGIWLHLKVSCSGLGLLQDLKLAGR